MVTDTDMKCDISKFTFKDENDQQRNRLLFSMKSLDLFNEQKYDSVLNTLLFVVTSHHLMPPRQIKPLKRNIPIPCSITGRFCSQ